SDFPQLANQGSWAKITSAKEIFICQKFVGKRPETSPSSFPALKGKQDVLAKGSETGDPEFVWKPPQDEWHSIALGYTSGTTSSPKGVVLHHRGAYLAATSNVVVWGIPEGAVYLWTLPMFHCNGWCFAWTLAAICGTNICLRQIKVDPNLSADAKDFLLKGLQKRVIYRGAMHSEHSLGVYWLECLMVRSGILI
ncbi:hypothetical protein M8C21_027630, partial [Ambrosia artemisiifolia]